MLLQRKPYYQDSIGVCSHESVKLEEDTILFYIKGNIFLTDSCVYSARSGLHVGGLNCGVAEVHMQKKRNLENWYIGKLAGALEFVERGYGNHQIKTEILFQRLGIWLEKPRR